MKKTPLHELDEIHASQALKQKTLQHVMHKKSKRISKGLSFGVIATACVCLLIFLYQGNPFLPIESEIVPPIQNNQVAYSYVSIDINPSLELVLDKENKVIKITTFNDDAKVLLNDYQFENKDAQTVLKEIVSLPAFQPYIEQGFLQVSIFSDDKKASTSIEKMLDDTLSQVLAQDQYGCSCASKQEKENADAHHMSFGKYQIINEIISKDASYQLEDLQNASMRELKDIYEVLFQKSFQGNGQNGEGHHGQKHK